LLNWYKTTFTLKAWTATTWHSDTIFGHLCWGMLYAEGEQRLRDFLRLYLDGQPPLLVSNGFPHDYLPAPLFPPDTVDTSLPLKNQIEQYREIKKTKGVKYVPLTVFNDMLQGKKAVSTAEYQEMVRVSLKNQINRGTGTSGEEGNLYNFVEYWQRAIDIYFKTDKSFLGTAERLFRYIAASGFGKRKSVGYGQVESFNIEPFSGFPLPQQANGFVSLSNFVPASSDPCNGFWQILVKYGKLGEVLAVQGNPFKKPLVMLQAGSTFYDAPCKEYYGGMISSLSAYFPPAVQYAYALPVPIIIPKTL